MMFVFAGFCRGPVDVDVVVDEGQRDPELFFCSCWSVDNSNNNNERDDDDQQQQ